MRVGTFLVGGVGVMPVGGVGALLVGGVGTLLVGGVGTMLVGGVGALLVGKWVSCWWMGWVLPRQRGLEPRVSAVEGVQVE